MKLPMRTRMVARIVSSKSWKANGAAASAPSATRLGTPRLGSARSQTCSINREPASISTLMTPASTPTAAKAPFHADRAVAIGHREGFDLPSDVRTTRSRRDQVEPQPTCGTEPVRSAADGVRACVHNRPHPADPNRAPVPGAAATLSRRTPVFHLRAPPWSPNAPDLPNSRGSMEPEVVRSQVGHGDALHEDVVGGIDGDQDTGSLLRHVGLDRREIGEDRGREVDGILVAGGIA